MSPTAGVVSFVVFWSEGWCEVHVTFPYQLQCLHVRSSINCSWIAVYCDCAALNSANYTLRVLLLSFVITNTCEGYCTMPVKSSRVDANTCLDARDHPDALATVKLDSWIVCVAREEHVSRLLSASGWWVICMWVRSLCWALHVRTACIAICKVVSKE